MGLLDALLKEYREEVQSGSSKAAFADQFVENVERKVLKLSTNSQHTELTNKNYGSRLGVETAGLQDPIFSISEKARESKKLLSNLQNVEDVACVRESESANLTSFIDIETPSDSSPVGSLSRAGNILNIWTDCGSCPACGQWNGYDRWRMGPGRYCFYTAYFKGKPARPVPIGEAQNACPKKDDPELYAN